MEGCLKINLLYFCMVALRAILAIDFLSHSFPPVREGVRVTKMVL